MIGVIQIGDWAAARRLTAGAADRFKKALDQAVRREAHRFRNQALKAFRTSGASNNTPWTKNTKLTIAQKRSSKPLINKGDLYGSIIVVPVRESTYFVGVPNNARSPKGEALTRIGRVHEYGAVITMIVTQKQYNFIMQLLAKHGDWTRRRSATALRPGSTLVIRIPERSFLRSTASAHFKPSHVQQRVGQAIAQSMGWGPGQTSPKGTP